jgi:hypothetical protein
LEPLFHAVSQAILPSPRLVKERRKFVKFSLVFGAATRPKTPSKYIMNTEKNKRLFFPNGNSQKIIKVNQEAEK